MTLYIADTPQGLESVWFLGDNFVAKSYRKHVKNSNHGFYCKGAFEVGAHCNSRYSCTNTNILSHIHSAFATALNKADYLPTYVVVVLDTDLLEALDFKSTSFSELVGPWLEWLAGQFLQLLQQKKNFLPNKCLRPIDTLFYWSVTPQHRHFDKLENGMRDRFNACLNSMVANRDNM